MKNWKPNRLGDFLSVNENNLLKIEPTTLYTIAGVQNGGKGVLNKRVVLGADLVMSFYKLVKPNQLLWCKVDTRRGAFGITRDENDNSVVSTNMHLADINLNKADPIFVTYLFQRKTLHKIIEGLSQGSTNRRYAKKEQIFEIEISLPTLPEQQRIVLKIESIKQRIEQIKKLRTEQEKEINFLRNSIFIDLQKEHDRIPIGKVIIPHNEIVQINPDETYKQVTVRMEHKGVLLRGMIKGNEIGSKQFLANETDFIISKIDARNGAMGMIPAELEGAVVTNDFPLFNFSVEINPKFFYYFSNTFYFDESCKKASEGTTNRKRLKMDNFANIQIPLPPITEQNSIVSLLNKLNSVKATHTETEKELTQLMPALLDKAFKGEL